MRTQVSNKYYTYYLLIEFQGLKLKSMYYWIATENS